MSRRRKNKQEGSASIIQRLGLFNIIFSLAWIAAVGAYFFGFWEVFSDSNVPINGVAWLILAFLIIVPILVVWGPYQILKMASEEQARLQSEQASDIERLRRNQNDLIHEMGELRSDQSDIATGVLPKHAAKVTDNLRGKSDDEHKSKREDAKAHDEAPSDSAKLAGIAAAGAAVGATGAKAVEAVKDASIDLDELDDSATIESPEVPPEFELEPMPQEPALGDEETVSFTTESDDGLEAAYEAEGESLPERDDLADADDDSDAPSDLESMAIALNFGDVKQKGDWEKAFETVSYDPNSLEFLRMTEDVLEAFEVQGILVETLPLRLANGETWYRFSRGERGEDMTELAGIQDANVTNAMLSYMRDNPKFKTLSDHFQRNFISMLERYSDDASDDEFEMLNDSRGGRLFIILADISGRFLK